MAACGSAQTAFFDAATLRAERVEWRGDRSGRVVLRRHVQVIVDTAVDPSRASSSLIVHHVDAYYGDDVPRAPVVVQIPEGAELASVSARELVAGAVDAGIPRQDAAATIGPLPGAIDPGDQGATVTIPTPTHGQLIEVVATFDVPGTLTRDARYLDTPGAPTAELLLRYDLPSHAVGAFQVAGRELSPLVTKQGGTTIIALLAKDLPPRADDGAAHARFVTQSAAPKNYAQRFARSWADVARAYVHGLVDASEALRQGFGAPMTPKGAGREAIDHAFVWVRDRIQVADALNASWADARPLVGHVEKNTLHQTDKVHLLHWLLDAASVPHELAVARSDRYPMITGDLPIPGAFDVPLVYVPGDNLWLDPACATCAPGTVRPSLRGRMALVLRADDPRPERLP